MMVNIKAKHILFGLNFLGIVFMCLVLSTDIFDFKLNRFQFTLERQLFTADSDIYELLANVTFRNETYYTHSKPEDRANDDTVRNETYDAHSKPENRANDDTVRNGTYIAHSKPENKANDDTVRNETYIAHSKPENRTNGDRVNNVAFLKVHKAGSTTMQNLFFRYGIRHNLNILLPKKGHHLYSTRQAKTLKPPKTYNIFAIHTVYSKKLFNQLIPTGSVKIGIVREPVDRLVSAAYYFRDVWHFKYLTAIPQANFFHNFINHQEIYDKSPFSLTHNSMAMDFGFSRDLTLTDKDEIRSYLESLNSEFILVMIMEKFDESLVMMKRYLSWSFLDIIYLKTNSHGHKPVVFNKSEQIKVRETNFLDFAIYEYFAKIFDEKLLSMSGDFGKEVEYFSNLLNDVHAFCSQTNLQDNSKLFVDKSAWDEEFTVLGEECRRMTTGELQFIGEIRKVPMY